MLAKDLATLKSSATVLSETATKAQILMAVADTIARIGPSSFKSLRNVELQTIAQLRQRPVAGTVLEPIANAAGFCGRPSDSTVGGLMDAMSLSQSDINRLACFCHNGNELSGTQAAANLREIAGKA